MLQTPFPFLPDQAVVISKHCALVRQDGQIAVLNAAGVFFAFANTTARAGARRWGC